jgi:HEAT repeat protein
MRNIRNKSQDTFLKMAAIGLAVLLGLSLFAPAGMAAAPAQQSDQVKRAQGLTYDSLDAILRDLANYKFDQGVGAPLALRAYIFSRKDDPAARKDCEAKLLAFLQTNPAPGGMMAACRSLSLIGGTASVPVLEAMLVKPETTDPARYALERIPGEEADRALLAALGKTQGDARRGIVSSLGYRATAAAAPALEKLINGTDTVIAGDAVKALGKIGTAEAGHVLISFLDRAKGAQKGEAASALLFCAAAWRRAGKTSEAAAVYDKLLAAGLPDVDRQAAFRMKLSLAGQGGQDIILKALAGKDAALFTPAIAMIHMAFDKSNIGQVLPFMTNLPEDAQVQLTAVLAGYPSDTVLPAILKAAGSPYLTVRMEALRSIGKIGNASVAGFLASRAAATMGDEQAAARETLWRLKGSDVDAAVVDRLAKESDDDIKAELIQAAGERRIAAAKPVLMETVHGGGQSLKAKAAASLRSIATYADLRDLLGLLTTLDDETTREAMQDTAAAAARTNPRPLARAGAVAALFADEKEAKKKGDLLRVLGKIGDDSTLPVVRRALAEPNEGVVDAAVRAMADWPGIAARDDVFGIAQNSPNLTHRVLALRAYVAMVGRETFRTPNAAVADLEKGMALASRPEEKKLVLGLLPQFPCEKGLGIAESLLTDPAVKAEAKAAADRIRQSLRK